MISRRILVISRSPALSRAVQASLGPGYQVVTSANVTDVADEVQEQGPFDVLVAGPVFDSHAGMARLAGLRPPPPFPAVVLALGPKPKASLSDIVRTGAVELIEYPTSKRQLADSLQRAFDIADISAVGRRPDAVPVVAQGVAVDRPEFAEVFTVASSSGGCGKTFYATNLACYLAAQTGQRVCLVDLDLQFGEVSTALHLRPRFTISDLLSREPVDDDDLDEHVEEYLEEHELGFSVLAAPFSPADADMIAPKDVYKVMGSLRRHFDYIVVDTPAQLSEIVLAAFDHSTRVLCMVTLDLPSIRNMRVFLTTLGEAADQQRRHRRRAEQGRGRHRHQHQRRAGGARQQDRLRPPVLARGHEVDQQGKPGARSRRPIPTSARSWPGACTSSCPVT